jgi:putative transposon-encoded protein
MRMEGYEIVEKVAMPSGTTARVLVPRHWIGKRVRAVKVDP